MDLLKELAVRSEKRRIGTGKREFLALQDEIEKALRAGYSVRSVWEYLFEQKLVSVQYQSFNYYVRLYGLRRKDIVARSSVELGDSRTERNEKKRRETNESKEKSPLQAGFTHNPVPKEDLL